MIHWLTIGNFDTKVEVAKIAIGLVYIKVPIIL
jgi:hypothetical protein